jgi:SAM-dependent methyltransferase
MTGRYTFGDGDLAAERLALVAEIFDPVSRELLASAVAPGPGPGPGLAVDLGCGPGYTTRLVADVCRPERTVGLERSEHFADLARRRHSGPTVEFAVHDVTRVPFPVGPADVVFARLLLAHLPDPLGLVARWRSQLAPGGVLVLDEIESMTTPPGPLRRYEDLVVALVAAEGGAMYAGPILAQLGGGRCPEVDVDAAAAARMYGMNLATWRHEARRRDLAGDAELDRLADDLAELAEGPPGGEVVHWVLRQLVVTGG